MKGQKELSGGPSSTWESTSIISNRSRSPRVECIACATAASTTAAGVWAPAFFITSVSRRCLKIGTWVAPRNRWKPRSEGATRQLYVGRRCGTEDKGIPQGSKEHRASAAYCGPESSQRIAQNPTIQQNSFYSEKCRRIMNRVTT